MTKFITLVPVLKIHDQLIERYGGRKGIHDLGLLKSAIEMPQAYFNGKYLHRTIFDKAAAYLFHISKNYPFIDGNKRTAGMIAMLFLAVNNITFFIDSDAYEKLILDAFQGRATKKAISKFFRSCKTPKEDLES